jgi:hypothetical protein
MSSVDFVVKGGKVVRRLVKEGINAAGVVYRVETFTNVGPDSRCEHCGRLGHIESNCSSKPTFGKWSRPHSTSINQCHVKGCIAKQGSSCGHAQDRCHNCKGNHIAFSSRCTRRRRPPMSHRRGGEENQLDAPRSLQDQPHEPPGKRMS